MGKKAKLNYLSTLLLIKKKHKKHAFKKSNLPSLSTRLCIVYKVREVDQV